MKVLITGAGGQLGRALLNAYEAHDVTGLSHGELDVAVEHDVFAAIGRHQPDLVVHAGAWTDVDGCELDPDRAHRVNALGPWWVARACEDVGATMVFISTDYVFGGRSVDDGCGYTEFDFMAPINVYGKSKAAGEQLVRGALDRHFIVRTSWLCGPTGSNFVTTMLRLGRDRGAVTVVDDQVGSPTFSSDLAGAIRELSVTDRFGTYHRTNTGACSWFDFAAAVFEMADLEVALEPMSSDALDRAAARPRWSVLSNAHAEGAGLMVMPHWRAGLAELLVAAEGSSDPSDRGGRTATDLRDGAVS